MLDAKLQEKLKRRQERGDSDDSSGDEEEEDVKQNDLNEVCTSRSYMFWIQGEYVPQQLKEIQTNP